MTEISGLKNIFDTTGTLHGIESPPDSRDYLSTVDYIEAYTQWHLKHNYWKVEWREPTAD